MDRRKGNSLLVNKIGLCKPNGLLINTYVLTEIFIEEKMKSSPGLSYRKKTQNLQLKSILITRPNISQICVNWIRVIINKVKSCSQSGITSYLEHKRSDEKW